MSSSARNTCTGAFICVWPRFLHFSCEIFSSSSYDFATSVGWVRQLNLRAQIALAVGSGKRWASREQWHSDIIDILQSSNWIIQFICTIFNCRHELRIGNSFWLPTEGKSFESAIKQKKFKWESFCLMSSSESIEASQRNSMKFHNWIQGEICRFSNGNKFSLSDLRTPRELWNS